MDAMSGSMVARGLIWLANNPAAFVATTLIGNDLANYLASLAIVLATARLLPSQEGWAAVIVPMAFSPVVFVYGELLPKNLFFYAPIGSCSWEDLCFCFSACCSCPSLWSSGC